MSEWADAGLAELHADWEGLLRAAGGDAARGEGIFRALVDAYRGPGRFYHNLAHLRVVLQRLDALRGRADDPVALRFAAWFHDAVYDPRAADNEERSAAWAARALSELGLPAPTVDEVRRLILLTKTRRPGGEDRSGHVLLDADLAILGADEGSYRAYARAVRQEYAWVDDGAYRAGRARVLRSFLERPRIYTTPEMVEAFEERARANLRGELQELEAGV
jgi:predicted metal-dependent HD superfamily phosphohydrolase